MKKYIAVLFMLIAGSVLAAKPSNPLYEAQVQATGVEPRDQPKLIQQGFKEILIKLSGSEKILTQPAIQKALLDPDKYVTQFSYRLSPAQERLLCVCFDEGLVNQLVHSSGQPIVNSKKQPSLLVWLVMQQEDQTQQWVEEALCQQWQTLAAQRGLSLVFPLLDLTDLALVSEQSAWSEDLVGLQTAARRYNVDRLLIGKLTKHPDGWNTQWILVTGGEPSRWETTYASTEALIGESLEALREHLAKAEAYESTLAVLKTVKLSVAGISGVEDYTKVLDYLKNVPQVKEVEVTEISPAETIFNIRTTANAEQLTRSIEPSQLLMQSRVVQADNAQSQSGKLHYKMVSGESE